MAFYKNQLVNHFKDLLPVLERAGAEASLNIRNFQVELRASGRSYTLYPQFVKLENGRRKYNIKFDRDVGTFIGWCPYFNKRWELSNEKLKFKAYTTANGLATPEYSVDPAADMEGVLVKKSVSSFSEGILGPFRSSREHPLDAGAGQFYERFVRGRIAKIFYFDGRAVCLELEKPASVVGDGRRTIGQLIEARVAAGGQRAGAELSAETKERGRERVARYLAFLGKSAADVPAAGVAQEIDFRYASGLGTPADLENIDLTQNPAPELAAQLELIGERLWNGIPADIRAGTLYTVDAVLDADDKLWLLEMNSNPFIHPYVYAPMLEALFRGQYASGFVSRVPATSWASLNEVLELAMTQLNSGAVEQGLALLGKILCTQPHHPAALFYSAWALARSGSVSEAKERLELLAKTALPDNIYLGPAADLLAAIGRHAVGAHPTRPSGVVPAGVLPPGAKHPTGRH
jgi:hypothetical protein